MTLSGTVSMLSHLFRKKSEKKSEVGYAELTRKSRVEKHSRNTRRRAKKVSVTSQAAVAQIHEPCRNIQEELAQDELIGDQGCLHVAIPPCPTEDSSRTMYDEAPRPDIGRSASSASCVIRNPFRSNTSDSVTTLSQVAIMESLTDAVDPVQRTVQTHRPRPTRGCVGPEPQKALVFTTPLEPFLDEASSESVSPVSLAADISSVVPEGPKAVQQSSSSSGMGRRWSSLKYPMSPKLDFLRVSIPSGVMSPPSRDHRHSFWSMT